MGGNRGEVTWGERRSPFFASPVPSPPTIIVPPTSHPFPPYFYLLLPLNPAIRFWESMSASHSATEKMTTSCKSWRRSKYTSPMISEVGGRAPPVPLGWLHLFRGAAAPKPVNVFKTFKKVFYVGYIHSYTSHSVIQVRKRMYSRCRSNDKPGCLARQ